MFIPCPELSKTIFYTTQKDSIKILYFQSASGKIIFMHDNVFFDKSVSLIVVTYTHTLKHEEFYLLSIQSKVKL